MKKFLLILILPSFLFAQKEFKADEIIEKSISAQGGKEVLKSLSSGIMESELTIYAEGNVIRGKRTTYIEYNPLKMRIEDKINTMTSTIVYDGQKGWMIQDGKVQELPEEWISYFKNSEKRLNILLEYKSKEIRTESLGLKETGDKVAYAIKFTDKDGEWMIFYFDSESFIPIKQEFNSINPETGTVSKTEILLDNYSKILDILTPMKVTVLRDGQKVMEVNFKNVQYNVPIESSLFQK
jgi:outer membrane lipoprotein-sorting protein